jgi:Glyoxalase/Bleomycin resistance protein/Dioxygenase superfamily
MNRTKVFALVLMLLSGALNASAQNAMNSNQVRLRYIVKDVPASVSFYRDKLGFTVDAESGAFLPRYPAAASSFSLVRQPDRAAPHSQCRTARSLRLAAGIAWCSTRRI